MDFINCPVLILRIVWDYSLLQPLQTVYANFGHNLCVLEIPLENTKLSLGFVVKMLCVIDYYAKKKRVVNKQNKVGNPKQGCCYLVLRACTFKEHIRD